METKRAGILHQPVNPNLVARKVRQAARKTAMTNTKAITDFSNYVAADLGPAAQHIHDQFVDNAATFATPTVTMTAFATQVADYNTKLSARASRATADALAFNDSRDS